MWGANEFGPDFQRILVRGCLSDPALFALVKRFVDMKQLAFTDPAAQWAWGVIASREYPTLLMLQTEAYRLTDNDPARVGAEAIISGGSVMTDTKYVREQIVEWARRQLFKLGFEESRQHWNAGRFQQAMDAMLQRIEEIGEIKIVEVDRGWFFEEFDLRQMQRLMHAASIDFFPTGIIALDEAMNGGLHYGELGVPMAHAKVGKTFFVIQQGMLCCRTRRRCLHFVLEGGRKKTQDRYEAAFTEEVYNNVRAGGISSDLAAKARREYAILQQHLVVRGFSDQGQQWNVSYEVILGELAELRRKGWVPDMVIVDYGDLMMARGDSEFDRQKAAFRQLKALSERMDFSGARGYAVWAPTQAQRPKTAGSDEKETILKPRDIADSYEKVRVCDAIVTINRTNSEREANQARVHLGAYRDAEDGVTVRVTTDYQHGLFCKINEAHEPMGPIPKGTASGAA